MKDNPLYNENIVEFSHNLEAEILSHNPEEREQWVNETIEIPIWRRTLTAFSFSGDRQDYHGYRAEILLKEKPTIWIEIDSRWSHAKLHHERGCGLEEGTPLSEWPLQQSVTDILKSIVGDLDQAVLDLD